MKVADAIDFAADRHHQQTYGALPYVAHLAQVVEVLHEYTLGEPELIVAGWLHDVIEDTGTSRAELAERFGEPVADLVWRVTDEGGALPDYRAKARGHRAATTLKLADRIANVEACLRHRNERLFGKYLDEQPELRRALFEMSHLGSSVELMWHRLTYRLERRA